jgi:hypothetical protein
MRRYILGTSDGFNLLVPARASHVPKPVAQASDAAKAAYDGAREAAAEFRAAREAAKVAPRIDAANDQAALAAGLPLPTDRLGPAASEALALAGRRTKAAAAARTDALYELARTVRHERAEWLPVACDAVEETRAKADALLRELAAAIDQLSAERAIARGLETWPEAGALTGLDVGFGHTASRDEDHAEQLRAQAAARIRDGDRVGGSGSLQVPREVSYLLGALRVEIDG